jgi:hypothetical protein
MRAEEINTALSPLEMASAWAPDGSPSFPSDQLHEIAKRAFTIAGEDTKLGSDVRDRLKPICNRVYAFHSRGVAEYDGPPSNDTPQWLAHRAVIESLGERMAAWAVTRECFETTMSRLARLLEPPSEKQAKVAARTHSSSATFSPAELSSRAAPALP